MPRPHGPAGRLPSGRLGLARFWPAAEPEAEMSAATLRTQDDISPCEEITSSVAL
jgi:hypothetical protein